MSNSSFDNIVVFNNTAALHTKRVDRYIKDIEKILHRKAKNIDITGYNAQKVHQIVAQAVEKFEKTKKTLIVIGGGDGTASSVIHGIVMSSAAQSLADRIVVLPLWGGNANDLAVMLNGLLNTVSLSKIFESAEIAEVYPLKLILRDPNGNSQTHIATCYASFGVTAQASWLMESSAHARDGSAPRSFVVRLSKEITDFWRALLQIEGFGIQPGDGGSALHMYERLFVNGSRIARIPNNAVKLTDKEYLEASANKKHLHLLIYAFKAFVRKNHGTITDETKKFVIKDATMAQIDGEIIGVEAGTAVEVGINPTPFYALTRKL